MELYDFTQRLSVKKEEGIEARVDRIVDIQKSIQEEEEPEKKRELNQPNKLTGHHEKVELDKTKAHICRKRK